LAVGSEADAARSLGRWQLAAGAALVLAIAGVLVYDVAISPAVPFLSRRDAPWIVAPTPLQTHGMEIDRSHPPTSFFARPFTADVPAGPVIVHLRALREVALFLNDHELPLEPANPASWRQARRVDLKPHLVAGRNVLAARVRNPDGNPALQLWVEGLPERIDTDARWLASWEGDPVAYAALAEDSLRHPQAGDLPAPAPSLAQHAVAFAALGAAGVLAFLGLRRRPARRAPAVALGLVSIFWVVLFHRILQLPAEVGFDAAAHLQYIDWIAQHHALPHPTDGALMYHPPLYHALSALLVDAFGLLGISEHAAVALLPMASGLGMAFVAGAMMRGLQPGAPWLEAGAVVAAGLLPMSVTVASSASNEAPNAFLTSLALLVALRAMLHPRASRRDDVLLGALLGAAALTKYTTLLWVPLLPAAVAAKRVAAERASPAHAARRALLSVAIATGLAGWVYARNALVAGDPLVWSLNADPQKSWWQLPGFHTADYFVRFGDALVQPWFASLHSFWDSVYTTLWGDGLLSGAIDPRTATRRWRYDVMAAGFLLALPATLLLVVGWLRALLAALRGNDLGRRLALSLLVALPPLLVAVLASGVLHYPFWSGPKAFYALGLTPTFAVLGVLGFAGLDGLLSARAPVAIRALPYGWAAAFLAAIAWSYAG